MPEELGRGVGYVEGNGSSTVLIPGYQSLQAVELPECAFVRVIANPHELANAYLRGRLPGIDRRWRTRQTRQTRRDKNPGKPSPDRPNDDRGPDSVQA